jgi:large subunit ribosomal protein L19
MPKHSTFVPVAQEPSQEVPVNNLKVKMKLKSCSKCWECPNFNFKGIRFDLYLSEEQIRGLDIESATA